MSGKQKIVAVGSCSHQLLDQLAERLPDCELVRIADISQLSEFARDNDYEAILLTADQLEQLLVLPLGLPLAQVLEAMPDGVVLVDPNNVVVWANRRFRKWCTESEPVGKSFYQALGQADLLGPDYCPLTTARRHRMASYTVLRCDGVRYFNLHAAPVEGEGGTSGYLIVTLRDVTEEQRQYQKLQAIYAAGSDLANLSWEDLCELSVEERIELLKEKIIQATKDILNYDTIEIRLLDRKTKRLEPLLSMGLSAEAANRVLYAEARGNGITGFVAATGKSYLCEDTSEDPLYLEGIKGGKSALTVPLKLHDEVIGTLNVESPHPRAFTASDLQFLEAFARQVALAINTLKLLGEGQAATGAATVEAIHSGVALPVDEILNDAVTIMERYKDREPELVESLRRILKNARDIKKVIHNVGQQLTPTVAKPLDSEKQRPALCGKRILVVDQDTNVRTYVHNLLEPYGCLVEGAPSASHALSLLRVSEYDAIISDIQLPDMPGYEFLYKVMDIWNVEPLPFIFVKGFGYDRHHTMIKAREVGVEFFLSKEPFSAEKLLDAVEAVVSRQTTVRQR